MSTGAQAILFGLMICCCTAFVFIVGTTDLDALEPTDQGKAPPQGLPQHRLVNDAMGSKIQPGELVSEEPSWKAGSDIESVLAEFRGTDLDGDLSYFAATL